MEAKELQVIEFEFPSPFGVICSLIEEMGYYNIDVEYMFPSPFGVICSLINEDLDDLKDNGKFPSPFGVICSLIYKANKN